MAEQQASILDFIDKFGEEKGPKYFEMQMNANVAKINAEKEKALAEQKRNASELELKQSIPSRGGGGGRGRGGGRNNSSAIATKAPASGAGSGFTASTSSPVGEDIFIQQDLLFSVDSAAGKEQHSSGKSSIVHASPAASMSSQASSQDVKEQKSVGSVLTASNSTSTAQKSSTSKKAQVVASQVLVNIEALIINPPGKATLVVRQQKLNTVMDKRGVVSSEDHAVALDMSSRGNSFIFIF